MIASCQTDSTPCSWVDIVYTIGASSATRAHGGRNEEDFEIARYTAREAFMVLHYVQANQFLVWLRSHSLFDREPGCSNPVEDSC